MQFPPASEPEHWISAPRRATAAAPAATQQFGMVWSAILAPAIPPLPAPIASPAPAVTPATSPQQQSGQGRQRSRD